MLRLLCSNTPSTSGGIPKTCRMVLRSCSRTWISCRLRKFMSSDLTSTSRERKNGLNARQKPCVLLSQSSSSRAMFSGRMLPPFGHTSRSGRAWL